MMQIKTVIGWSSLVRIFSYVEIKKEEKWHINITIMT